jgi:hypothetical protein
MVSTPLTSAVQLARTSLLAGGIDETGYLLSHTISVVWQCVQGVDASNKGFFRSHGQTQARGLTHVTECRRFSPCSPGFRRLPAPCPSPAGSALAFWGERYLVGRFYLLEHYRYALRRAPMPPWGVPVRVSSNCPLCITPARRNFQSKSRIFLSATLFFTALISLRCGIVSTEHTCSYPSPQPTSSGRGRPD